MSSGNQSSSAKSTNNNDKHNKQQWVDQAVQQGINKNHGLKPET